ncbi:S-adenosyl-L-methionine-dependent methyltransferases superfamily protein [Perilla frutescens var. hirtella]|nr:S-adenosyl-L-methionine-dependent methyltransferases superfamily protein [Perilla frutescens var. hirtella]
MKGKYTSSAPPSHSSSTSLAFIIKIVAFFSLLSFSLFFLYKHFSVYTTATENQQLYFFNSTHTNTVLAPAPAPSPPRRSGSTGAGVVLESTGIINEFGIMTADFMVGEFEGGLMQSSVVNANIISNREKVKRENDEGEVIKVEKFRVCDVNLSDYIPCLDNVAAASSSTNGETEKGKGLDCLVPRPKGYKHPIPWPESRDEVWFDNVPHTLQHNEGINGVLKKDDKLIFKGDEPQSGQHLDQMVPEIAFGQRTRLALDIIGSGIANFGAYLMELNVTTLSVAPKDHESRIQLALERGLPAMVATFGTRRLPFPSQAFDLIHCSRCGMNWTLDDGVLLLEANRILRAGGYFVWEALPVSNYEGKLGDQWREMDDLTRNLCWELVNYKEGHIAIWQKPLNNSCYLDRDSNVQPSLCEADDNPDDIWNVNMKKCITRLSENGTYGANITNWPARLHSLPYRLFGIKTDADVSREPLYRADSLYWNAIVGGYTSVFKINEMKIRNVMDMKAGYGGFAAALLDSKANSWVMNVVPVSGPNTLPVIYDRGLVGVMHDWCEPFNTHPRTYDLLNAAGLFFVEQRRCNIRSIMVEMDRMLRGDGRVYIRDTTAVIYELQEIATAMGWTSYMFDTEEGPYSDWKLLICTKPL